MTLKKSQKSLKNWGKQKWRTKSGKPSAKTGERYLPEKAIKTKESSVRGALGMKGSGRLNKIRRTVQGPIGYASIGAAAFSGGDE